MTPRRASAGTAVTIVAAVLAAGCGSLSPASPTTAAATPPPATAMPSPEIRPSPNALSGANPGDVAPVAWKPCGDRFECGTVTVPVDTGRPDGATIDLAIARLPATGERVGSLIVHPGGPGVSAIDFVRQAAVATIPTPLRTRFDIVAYDQRGVGDSHPVRCDPRLGLPAEDASTAAGWRAWDEASAALAKSCATQPAELLNHLGVRAHVSDLDTVRAAVGDDRLTYVGYSYGTLLGAAYASAHPDRIRALALDGAVDPALGLEGQLIGHAQALEKALVRFHETCNDQPDCQLPPAVSSVEAFDELLASLRSHPLPAPMLGDRTLTPGDVQVATLALLRTGSDAWPLLAVGLTAAYEGDGSVLLAAADQVLGRGDGVDDPALAALEHGGFYGQYCADTSLPADPSWAALRSDLRNTSPRFGASVAALRRPCAHWPAQPSQPLSPLAPTQLPPVVVVGNTGDVVTPYPWSQALAGQLPGAVRLTRDGERHTAFGGDNRCVDRAVTRYLADLIPPDPSQVCG